MTDTPETTTDKAKSNKLLQTIGSTLGYAVAGFPFIATTTNLFGWTQFSFFEATSVWWAIAAYFILRQAVTEGVAAALTRYKVWESVMVANALAQQYAAMNPPKPERDPNEVIVPFDPTKKG